MSYTARQSVPGTSHQGPYNFTLVSASTNRFESIVSTVLTPELNNTVAKCVDTQSEAQPVTIRIAGKWYNNTLNTGINICMIKNNSS